MAFCANCGKELSADEKFCSNCGAEVANKTLTEEVIEELAYEFIDFMITYENSLTNAQFVGYCPTLKVVYNSIVADPDFEDVALHEAYYPGDIENGEVYQYLGPEIYNLYEEIYKRVNAS